MRSLKVSISRIKPIAIDVWVADAGSRDSTVDFILEVFPEANILNVSSNVFWNQGMRIAWDAAAQYYVYDGYFWLNDDVILTPCALRILLEGAAKQKSLLGESGVVVGSCADPDNHVTISYGGYLDRIRVIPSDTFQEISTFNGNLVFISNHAFSIAGNLSSAFLHRYGDVDYGNRCKLLGVNMWLAPGILGYCKRDHFPKWQDSRFSLWHRIQATTGPKGISLLEVISFKKSESRGHWLLTYLRLWSMVFFPPKRP